MFQKYFTKYLLILLHCSFCCNLGLAQSTFNVDYNPPRGFYTSSVAVTLSTALQNATIRYTVNGKAPTTTYGFLYTGPFSISSTAVIRAVAFSGAVETPVATHTYIYPNQVANQFGTPAGYPTSWQSGYAADYDMDPQIKNDPTYGPMIASALTSLPSMSLVMDPDDLFNSTTGIYVNSENSGINWERAASIELIDPAGIEEFQENCGIRIHGGSSRRPEVSPKHSFRLLFKADYGDTKLRYPLFGPDATDKFDTYILRAGAHFTMTDQYGSRRNRPQKIKDEFFRQVQLAMGQESPHGRFVHLYINGLYWGLYNPVERPSAPFLSEYYGGVKEDFDAINSGEAVDGDLVAWNNLFTLVNSGLSTAAKYNTLKTHVDVENLIDYMILNQYGRNTDWDFHNWYAGKKRSPEGRWRFYSWDTEFAFGFHTYESSVFNKNTNNAPTRIFQNLRANPEFLVDFGDRVQCQCFNDGVLQSNNAKNLYQELHNSMVNAWVPESARWGDYRRDVDNYYNGPYELVTLYGHYIPEYNDLMNNVFPNRTNQLINLYKANNLFPNLNAVQFSQNGGGVPANFQLVLTNPNGGGSIYYTDDGTDPRAAGGGLSATAKLYTSSFPINGTVTIKARVRSGSVWSAACPVTFYAPQDFSGLVINEINYHPSDGCTGGLDDEEYEFIEIKNAGNVNLNMTDVYFSDGISFKFPQGTYLAPNNYIVLAGDAATFQAKYSFAPFGEYLGKLSNGGETIVLANALGTAIDEVSYQDKAPWPVAADGQGPSLELTNSNLDNSIGNNWHASLPNCGTPGQANSNPCASNPPGLVINEIHYNSIGSLNSGDWVEIYNPTSSSVNLSGWHLQDGSNDFTIPAGSTIPANGYFVLVEKDTSFTKIYPDVTNYVGDLGFGFSDLGEFVKLLSPQRCAVDAVEFGVQSPWPGTPNGTGPTLSLNSTGANNNLPSNWSASSNHSGTPGAPNNNLCAGGLPTIVINEINYNSILSNDPGDWIELYNPAASSIDLSNWEFHDGKNIFTIPAGTVLSAGGYMILTENASQFSGIFPNVGNVVGDWGFNLTSLGERVAIYNDNRCLIDAMIYDEQSPWPTLPNGNGTTLSLTSPGLNNSVPGSWDASSEINAPFGTPGRANEECPAIQIISPSPVCLNQSGSFSASENLLGASYSWSLSGGAIENGAGSSINASWSTTGVKTVTLTVSYFECTYSIIKNITVVSCNNSPVANNDSRTVQEDGLTNGNVTTNDSDPDGDNITVNTTPISSPSNGSLSLSGNGAYTYLPNSDFYGTDNFVYEICDDGIPMACDQATVNITVNPVNDAPVVNNNSVSVQEDFYITILVLNNDSDIDGNLVPGSVTINNPPPTSQGGVSVNASGHITFFPASNFNGVVNPFQYTVCDDGTPLPAECGTATVNITVTPINDAPTATNDSFSTNEDTQLSGTILNNDADPENNPLTVNTSPISPPDYGTLTMQSNGNFTYSPNTNFNGSDDFVYEVCDNGNPALCDQATVNITINAVNDAPVLSDDNVSTPEDIAITIPILNNDNDVDGNLNISGLTLNNLPPLSQGVATANTNGTITFTPASNFGGVVNPFTYTICDTGTPLPAICETATIYIIVTSTNDPPQAINDTNVTSEDNPAAGNTLTNDIDLDGDNLSLNTAPITAPANGTIVLNTNGSYTYTPNSNFNGLDNFVYEVCDDGSPVLCDQATVTIQIDAVNDPPILQPDNVSTDEDQSLLIQVLSNDNDIDGSIDVATLTISNPPPSSQGTVNVNANGTLTFVPSMDFYGNVNQFSYTICDNGTPLPAACSSEMVTIFVNSVNDAPVAALDTMTIMEDNIASGNLLDNDVDLDNNNLATTVITMPGNGNLLLQPSGIFTYTPDVNYNGLDSFTYEVCDDGTPSLCDQALVFIDVLPVNDAPVLLDDNPSTNEDTPVTISILTNDNDPDANLNISTLTLNGNPPANQGTVQLNANGTIIFTPAANFNGNVDPFSYTICDDGFPLPAACSQAIVRISVVPVNDPPIAYDDTNLTLEDTPITGNLLTNDADPIDGNNLEATITSIVPPDFGVVIIAANGSYTYTPDLDFNGSDDFKYQVCDDGVPALCDEAIVSILVSPVNDAPAITTDNITTPEETTILINPILNDSDVDGNLLINSLNLLNNIPAAQGAITLNQDGTLTFAPATDFYGSADPLQYEICDDGAPTPGLCATGTININVTNVNDAPVAENDLLTTQEDQPLSGNLLGNDYDIENDALTLTSTPMVSPANGVVSLSSNGTFVYTPTTDFYGMDSFTYEVCDDGNPVLCDEATVIVTISSCPDASIVLPGSLCAGGPLFFQAVDQGPGAIYEWNFGAGATPSVTNGQAVLVQYSSAGNKDVQLTITQNGCVSEENTSISLINGGFFPQAGSDATICPGGSVQIGGAPTGPVGASYSWTPTTGLNTSSASNPVAYPDSTTTYTVEVSFGTCIFSDQVTITVLTDAVPFADAGTDVTNCGGGIQIGGSPSGIVGSSYSWAPTFGLSDPSSPNPIANHIATQTYTLTVSRNGCSKTDQVVVERFFPPNIDAGSNQTICFNPLQQGVILGGFNNLPGPDYQWSPVEGLTNPTEGNTFANPSETTMYYLSGSTDGCATIDSVLVTVDVCNDPPVALLDVDSTIINENISGNVLSNDYDPNGDQINMNLVPIGVPVHGVVFFYANGDFDYSPNFGYVGTDYVNYEICDDGIPQFCTQGVLQIEITEPRCIDVDLGVFLEGAFEKSAEEMHTSLNTIRGVLPGQTPINPFVTPTPAGQPYNISPWFYAGTEGLDFTSADYSSDIVDWVLVSFRTTPFKSSEVLSTAGLVKSDGKVVFPDSCFMSPSVGGPFYIVIEHRNHVGVMSDQLVEIVEYGLTYDFRVRESYKNSTTYGQKQIIPGVFCMIAGDGDQASDFPSYDITGEDKIVFTKENGKFDLYLPADYSMDGDVSGVDKILWTENNGIHSSVPK